MGVPAATRMVLSHSLGGSKDDAVGPRHLMVSSQTRAITTHLGPQSLGGAVAQFLGNLPMTLPSPIASLCSSGNWSSPAGRAHQLISHLIKREEALRKSPFSIHTNHSCFSQDTSDTSQQEVAGEQQYSRQLPLLPAAALKQMVAHNIIMFT